MESKLVRFLKEQIEVENEIIDSLNKGVANIANPVVKETLKGISFDSMKHSEMYSAALKFANGDSASNNPRTAG